MTDTLATRLKALRKQRGMTQTVLAERANVATSTIGNIESGTRGYGASIVDIARVLQTTPAYLRMETDDPTAADTAPEASAATVAAVMPGLVPVISWVQAGQWAEAVAVDPREVEEWLPCPVRHSPRAYALRVRGDSMTAPIGQRSYPEGSIVFVEPERRSPHNGERIIALRIDSDEATFKVYKNEDGRQWLQPLNPTHEPIRDPFEVLGTVIGVWIEE